MFKSARNAQKPDLHARIVQAVARIYDSFHIPEGTGMREMQIKQGKTQHPLCMCVTGNLLALSIRLSSPPRDGDLRTQLWEGYSEMPGRETPFFSTAVWLDVSS